MDTAAPQVVLQHQQDLAGAVQSSRFLSVLIALAALLFALGEPRNPFSTFLCFQVYQGTIFNHVLVQA